MSDKTLKLSVAIEPAEPLWKRAPTKDEFGKPVVDFVMIIPKLGSKPKHEIQNTLAAIETSLQPFTNTVLFANIDLKLNTLWVSCRAVSGILLEITALIKHNVPEAKIISDFQQRVEK